MANISDSKPEKWGSKPQQGANGIRQWRLNMLRIFEAINISNLVQGEGIPPVGDG